jgi:mono/diheme cytochrome c family protein
MKARLIVIICIGLTALIVSCQSDEQVEFNRYFSAGSTVYQVHCQNCHGTKGEGLRGLIPSLNDSTYLKRNKDLLACFVKTGLKGQISISGKQFEGEMPPNDLSPVEIAQVLTYVTNSFGNKMSTFNTEKVNADLTNCN